MLYCLFLAIEINILFNYSLWTVRRRLWCVSVVFSNVLFLWIWAMNNALSVMKESVYLTRMYMRYSSFSCSMNCWASWALYRIAEESSFSRWNVMLLSIGHLRPLRIKSIELLLLSNCCWKVYALRKQTSQESNCLEATLALPEIFSVTIKILINILFRKKSISVVS